MVVCCLKVLSTSTTTTTTTTRSKEGDTPLVIQATSTQGQHNVTCRCREEENTLEIVNTPNGKFDYLFKLMVPFRDARPVQPRFREK